jgi:hypothetical protein
VELFRHQKYGYAGDKQTYRKNEHGWVHRHITRTQTGSQTSQEHKQVHRHHRNTNMFTDITGTHKDAQEYHKHGHIPGSYRDLSLSIFTVEDS